MSKNCYFKDKNKISINKVSTLECTYLDIKKLMIKLGKTHLNNKSLTLKTSQVGVYANIQVQTLSETQIT